VDGEDDDKDGIDNLLDEKMEENKQSDSSTSADYKRPHKVRTHIEIEDVSDEIL